jgi:hypothetical protein
MFVLSLKWYLKIVKWNVPNTVWKRGEEGAGLREYTKGGEFVQSTLYTSMELSQWDICILLMYDNKN